MVVHIILVAVLGVLAANGIVLALAITYALTSEASEWAG
jgi:hypothetical protein